MLAALLPRFNARFGVPAVQPGSAYRSVNPDLDLGGVRCIKELRRVAKDNTVQYHGQVHRDLVVAGMERARQQGKRIGRPSMNERPEFEQRFAAVVQRIGSGELSRNQAARELGIGYATLKRLLQAWEQPKPSHLLHFR